MIDSSAILNGKLLIVDDEKANVLLLERLLRSAGYVAVDSTTDPSRVCELHDENRYDLILLDLQMPGVDGFALIEQLKVVAAGDYLPVLVLTAQSEYKIRALKAGAKDFLSKPFDLAEVLVRVRNMLEVRLGHMEMKHLYELEKSVADKLRRGFAQRALPSLPGVSLSATYAPATEDTRVGGDWYDAIELPDGRLFFAIGDVAGHGIDAAIAMNRARYAVLSSAVREANPALVLQSVNEELMRDHALMLTALAGVVDPRTFDISYSNAGHPPGILMEPGAAPRFLEIEGPPLSVVDTPQYSTFHVRTVPGALLVMYTDGAIEHTKNILEGQALMLAATASLAGRPHHDAAAHIRDRLFGGQTAADDVAIMTIAFP